MAYLEFKKEELTNLNESLKAEYLATNNSGSYACSTVINCNTRKYHGLLVCPLPELDGEKYVLLSSLDETIVEKDASFNLGCRKYPSEFNPLGHKYATHFEGDVIPTAWYRVGDSVIKREILLASDENKVLVRYTLEEAANEITLKLKPYLAFRKVHDLTHANLSANVRCKKADNGVSSQLYSNFPELFMQTDAQTTFIPAPDWYYNIEYERELERAYTDQEDLFVPGFFETKMVKGQQIVFSAGTAASNPAELKSFFNSELAKLSPRKDFDSCLDVAAEQFIGHKKNGDVEIIASYPWAGDWGRDSLIAATGLTLCRRKPELCLSLLKSFASMLTAPIHFSKGNIDHYDVPSADTALWFAWTSQQYLLHTGDMATVKEALYPKLKEIIDAYINSASPDIQLHSNGLIYIAPGDTPMTWMDATWEGRALVHRHGYVVEINALWYNALSFALEIANKTGDQYIHEKYSKIQESLKENFCKVFWCETTGTCADFVIDGHKDYSVRPNQIIACSVKHSPLDELMQKRILEVCEQKLLTPKGVRSLSPQNPLYRGYCSGNMYERASAYHQGSVWPWLLGAFTESYLRIHGKAGVSKIKRIYTSLEEEVHAYGIGSIAEIFDGNPPHQERGSISQAWNVAEIIRIKHMLDSVEQA
jgi:predicted glycogen debranching enzyme